MPCKYVMLLPCLVLGVSFLIGLPAHAQEAAMAVCAKNGVDPSDQGSQIAACTSVIKSSAPEKVRGDAYYNRAQVYRRQKKWDDAIGDFSSAIAINQNDLSSFVNRGDSKMMKGDFAAAVGDFTVCIKGTEATFFPQLKRGVAYLGSADYANAIGDFNAALKFDSDNEAKFKTPDIKLQNDSYPLYGRGLAKIKSGDDAGGKADLQKAVALKPTVADFFTTYGLDKPSL